MNIAVPQTAHSYAYDSLRAQIMSGVLSPGTPLVQANLAHELGISMTPIREALRDLATEGLVTLVPHRGAVVTSLDLSDALEIHRIRLTLEPDAVAAAVAAGTDSVLERLTAMHAQMREATSAEWVVLNRDFHVLLLSTTPSRRLHSLLRTLLEAAALYVGVAMPHRHGTPQAEHQQLLDAYRARDAEAAKNVMSLHITTSIESLEDAALNLR